jgi:hypothetical protein
MNVETLPQRPYTTVGPRGNILTWAPSPEATPLTTMFMQLGLTNPDQYRRKYNLLKFEEHLRCVLVVCWLVLEIRDATCPTLTLRGTVFVFRRHHCTPRLLSSLRPEALNVQTI